MYHTNTVVYRMLVLTLLFLSSGVLAYVEYDIQQAEALFEKFITDYGRVYKGIEEKQMRFENFKERLQEINMSNKQHGYNVMGINLFADMSKEEFESKYHGCVLIRNTTDSECPRVIVERGDVPESFDWRDHGAVTRVKDQGGCGSCWAFSTIGNVESQHAIKNKQLVELSEQQEVDCDMQNDGCKGGSMTSAVVNLMNVEGVMRESDYPYIYSKGSHACTFDKNKVAAKVVGCQDFSGSSEEDIKSILVKYGPLTIALAAEPFMNYNKGVFKHCDAGAKIDHGLLLVGYGTDEETKVPYWIIKNSWGETFGENGYLRMMRGNKDCLVGKFELVSSIAA